MAFRDYVSARAHSEAIRQHAISDAEAKFQVVADRLPALVAAEIAATYPNGASPENAAAVQASHNRTLADAAIDRAAAIRAAEREHHDRLAVAGRMCGVRNSSPGDPHAAHAVRWFD